MRELPRFASPASGGAHDLVRQVAGRAQPAPHDGRVPSASVGERPVVVWYIGQGRLGVPQQHQLPARDVRHVRVAGS
jgi:hypothetical protein